MKKFVIHTLKGKTSIFEVECTPLTPGDDPYVAWLIYGEYRARIDAPASLFDKIDGKMVAPVWHSFVFFDTLEDAKSQANKDVRAMLERNKRKNGTDFTEEDVKKQLNDIQVIILEGDQ
jgi:hypothetical protein